jgi:hypothetical protein
MSVVLPTKVGKQLFPATSASIRGDEHLQQLCNRVAVTIKSFGKHNKLAAIQLLTDGLPSKFLKESLGVSGSFIKKRFDRDFEDPEKHSVCTMKYAAEVSRGKITKTEIKMYKSFFEGSSAVFSGTERRCVEYTMHDWECKVTHMSRNHIQPASQSSTINPRSLGREATHMTEPQTIS